MTTGSTISFLQWIRGLHAYEVARTGKIHKGILSNIKRDIYQPTTSTLTRIAKGLGLPVDLLLLLTKPAELAELTIISSDERVNQLVTNFHELDQIHTCIKHLVTELAQEHSAESNSIEDKNQ